MATKKIKTCKACKTFFKGRKDSKTCSAACRKRLQRGLKAQAAQKAARLESALGREFHRIAASLMANHVVREPFVLADERGGVPAAALAPPPKAPPVDEHPALATPTLDEYPEPVIPEPGTAITPGTTIAPAASAAPAAPTPEPMAAPESLEPSAFGNAEVMEPADNGDEAPSPKLSARERFMPFHYNKLALTVTGLALLLITVIGGGTLFLSARHNQAGKSVASQPGDFAVTNLPLGQIKANQALQVEANQVTINGQLTVNQTLVIAPTDRPTAPVRGQIYYDQATNQPYYYDGTQFISLAPQQSVTSLGGASGDISLGNGLSVVNNQLDVSAALTQQINNAANSGVLSLAGTANQINVSGSTGNITLSLPQDIATGSTPIFGGLTLNGQLVVTGGANIAGTVTLGSLGAGLVLSNGAGTLSSGTVDRNNASYLTGTLTVPNGGTGAASFTSNGILYGNGAGALQVTNSLANATLVTNGAGLPSLSQTLPLDVQNNITHTGVLSWGSITAGFGAIATVNNISTTAQVQAGTLQVDGGSFTIDNAGNFVSAGTGTIQGAGGLTIGVANTTAGSLYLANSGNIHYTILQGLAPAGTNQTITIPNSGLASDTVCLLTMGNCVGVGGAVSASGGIQNYITKFINAGGTQIGNSLLFDNGTSVGVNTALPNASYIFDINGNLHVSGTSTFDNTLGITAGGANIVGNVSQTGTGTFGTGTGNVSLNGATTVTGTNTFNVGTGTTTLGGVLNVTTGLATLSGGLSVSNGATITGLTNINISGTANTYIGNATGTLGLASVAFNVTTAGALSGITGYIQSSGNFAQSGVGTFGTGTGAVSLNGATTVSSTLTVQGAGGITVGVAGATAGIINLANGTNTNLSVIQSAAPSGVGNATYNLPTIAGGTSDNICLVTLGNCAGSGTGVTGSGTIGTLAVFTGGQAIGNSVITQSGSAVTVTGTLAVTGANSLTLGTSLANTGSLILKNSNNSNTLTLQSGATASNLSFTLPTADGSNGNCIQTNGFGAWSFQTCTGGPGGGVTSVDSQTGIVTIANSSGGSGIVTIDNAVANGVTKGIATFNATNFTDNGSGVINTIQNIATSSSPTFSSLTLQGNTTGLTLTGTPAASATSSLVQVGSAIVGGNSAANGGTYFGLNEPAAGAGSAADFLNFQVNGTSKLKVDNSGNITAGGTFNGATISGGSLSALAVNGLSVSGGTITNPTIAGTVTGSGSPTITGFGTYNLQTISSTANFTGTVAIQGSNALTLGTSSLNTGAIIFKGSGGPGTLTLQGPTTPDAGNFTLTIPAITGNANVCTDNSICTGYAPSSGGNYIAKNAADTSSASVAGNLLGLTNTNTGAAGVLSLTNNGTNSALSVLQSGTSEPSALQALILANNNTATPTGNLLDLQNKGTSELHVDVSGNLTTIGNIQGVGITATGNITIGSGGSLKLTGDVAFPGSPTEGQVYYRTDNKQLYVYENAKWQADRSTATLIVAASNTQNKEKADYVATGTNDETTLAAAVAALPAAGGTIVLLEGTFNIGANLNGLTTKSNVNVIGLGRNTVLKRSANGFNVFNSIAPSNFTFDSITFDDNGNTTDYFMRLGVVTNFTVKNSYFINSASGSQAPVAGFNNGTNVNIINNYFSGSANYGMRFTGTGINISGNYVTGFSFGIENDAGVTSNNTVTANTGGGVFVASNATVTGNKIFSNTGSSISVLASSTNVTISSNSIYSNVVGVGGGGISLGGSVSDSNITNNQIYNNTSVGIYSFNGIRNNIVGNTITGNSSYGIQLNFALDGNQISDNNIYNNGGSSGDSGIALTNGSSTNAKIVNNRISDTAGTSYAIEISSGAVNTYLSNNTYSGTGAASISDLGTGTIYGGQLNGSNQYVIQGTTGVALNDGTVTSTATTFNLLQSTVTTLNIGAAVGAGGINLAGGSGSTGCTLDGSNGNFTCSGNITGGATGTAGYWTRSAGLLQPATAGDAITTSGNISTSGTGSITSSGTLTVLGSTITSRAQFTTYTDYTGVGALSVQRLATTIDPLATTFLEAYNSTAKALVVRGAAAQTASLQEWQNSSGTALSKIDATGDLLAASVATATTGTTEAVARTNVTTVTLTAAGSFANNDVIFINNAGQDYYTRIVSGGGTTTLTVSPAVSYDVSASVTKYTIQNIGATATDYTTQANRFFQGYFTGGVVTGAGSTTYSDGNINSATAFQITAPSVDLGTTTSATSLNVHGATLFKNVSDSATAFQIQNSSGSSALTVDTTNLRVDVGTIGTPTGQLYVSGSVPTAAIGSVGGISAYPNSRAIYVSGNYAYVASWGSNLLVIYDVSNPASPVEISSIATGTTPSSVYVAGKYAYVVGSTNFQVYNVSNPSSPQQVASLSFSGIYNSNTVYVQGRYAYVTGGTHFDIFDVSNPAQPVRMSTSSTNAYAMSVYVQGNYAYVAIMYGSGSGVTNTFNIYNVSNPSSPSLVGHFSSAGGYGYTSISVQGRYAYLTGEPNGASTNYVLQVVDISNPASPTAVGSANLTTNTNYSYVYVQGRYAYVNNYGNLDIFDISNPASPSLVGSPSTGGTQDSIFVQGRYLYMNTATNLKIFDLGGQYSQQLQAGGTETGTLQVDTNAQVGGDINVQGGLSVGQSAEINGNLAASGSALFQNSTNSTTAFQIQNAAGTTTLFNADTTNQQLIAQSGYTDATLGAALIDTAGGTNDFPAGWSGTGWTLGANSAVHTSGTTALSSTWTPTIGVTYQVTYTYSSCTNSNTLGVAMGGQTLESTTSCVGTNTKVITATSTAALRFTPNSTYVGTVSNVTVYAITQVGSVLTVNNSSAVATLQVRSSGATSNTFIGLNAGQNNTSSGTNLTAFGANALQNNTTGYQNTAVGSNALQSNTTGRLNTAVGSYALYANTTGIFNIAVGSSALQSNTTGNFNTAVGVEALQSNTTGSNNAALGYAALQSNTTGSNNAALGLIALYANTTGSDNTALGYGALTANTTGSSNAALGEQALDANTTGSNNAAIGYRAGYTNTPANANTTGSNNTFLGYQSGPGVASASNLQNSTAIGTYSVVSQNDSLVLGCVSGTNGCTATTKVGIAVAAPTATLSLAAGTTAAEGIAFGTDTNLYRVGAGRLTTDTNFEAGGFITAVSGTGADVRIGNVGSGGSPGITFAATHDTTLYRPGAGALLLQGTANSATAFQIQDLSNNPVLVVSTNNYSGGANAANATLKLAQDSGTSRSINAAGSINASGADYAEYIPWSGAAPAQGSVVSYGGSVYVVSDPTTAAFVGNDKFSGGSILVTFAGQVPVRVNGPVAVGDILVDNGDGTAKAVSPSNATVSDYLGKLGIAQTSGTGGTVMAAIGTTSSNVASALQQSGSSFTDLNVSGVATIHDLTVSGTATIGILHVTGSAEFAGDITVGGHIITAGGQPVSVAQAAAGGSASVSVDGTDTTGTITITTGSVPSAGDLAKILFSKTYGTAPHIVLSPSNDKASGLHFYRGATTTANFMFDAQDTPVPNTTYTFDYFIAQ